MKKQGFSLVEVSLYLALSALLAAGIIISTYTNLGRQRYNNSVQEVTDFLSSVYASVINVKNGSDGRTGKAIYGKLVTFGEKADENSSEIFIYDVVGKAIEINDNISKCNGESGDNSACSTTLGLLTSELVNANIFYMEDEESGEFKYTNVASFKPSYDAKIENGTLGQYYTGALLIIRSPISGNVTTYYTRNFDSDIQRFWVEGVGADIHVAPSRVEMVRDRNLAMNYLRGLIANDKFHIGNADYCLYSEDYTFAGNVRADIRIVENAHSSSGVILVPTDKEGVGGNICK